MSRRQGLKQIKDNAQSLAISLCVHAVVLLCLYWLLWTTVVRQQTLILTATTTPSTELQPLVSVLPTPSATPARDTETPVQIETLQAKLFASIDRQDFRPQSDQGAVEFFGSAAYGSRFVYVLDISMSMSARENARFERAKDELIRSVSRLSPQQSYYVFLFCAQTYQMYGNPRRYSFKNSPVIDEHELEYETATAESLGRLRDWLRDVRLAGGTDPRCALSLAHQMQPDAVFFLSDGQFYLSGSTKIPNVGWSDRYDIPRAATVLDGVKLALSDIPIHTIAYENPFTVEAMQRIANATGGSSRYVKTPSLKPLVFASFVNGLLTTKVEHQRAPDQLERHHAVRLKHARTLIEDGELAFAEYLIRPAQNFAYQSRANRELAQQIDEILAAELGAVRLEDFKEVPMKLIERSVQLGKSLPRFRD